MLTLERATMPDPPAPVPSATPQPWHCRCGRYLGRWINGVLHEPGGAKSGCPVVRRCPSCGRRVVKLAQADRLSS